MPGVRSSWDGQDRDLEGRLQDFVLGFNRDSSRQVLSCLSPLFVRCPTAM